MNMKHIHLPLLLCFFLLLHLHGILCKKEASLNKDTDKDALLSFKSVISDPNKALSDWSSTSDSSHCNWHGVSCSKVGSRVQSLSLPGLGLSGKLPSSLSNLSYLHLLDLSNNSFHGQIPPQFSRLSLLNMLSLAFNNLSGTLPPQLGLLHRLQYLDLSINSLTGPLPRHFGNLSSLTGLFLARNHLIGKIPSELGNLRNLSHLHLFDNYFSGDFPFRIFNTSSLVFLSVTSNHLSGKLPQDIGHSLPNIKGLFLANNRFGGEISSSISNASQLHDLDLSNNEFHGWVPLFNNMNELTSLNLGRNHFSSTTLRNSQLFGSLGNSRQLQFLKLHNNRLAGELPSSAANLSSNLQHFCVAGNLLSGRIPLGMGKFRNLEFLTLENNFFTGEIPTDVGALHKLVHLVAYHNRLSGEIPNILGNFTQLSILDLGYNQFAGKIPTSVGHCKQLIVLVLGMNRLHGTIPNEIFELSMLNTLYLPGNALHGPFPSEVNSLQQLQFMDISDNQLSGFIPKEIGGCRGLQWLKMARNNISGLIPDSLGNLRSLETLDLSSNNLSGQIPENLENLQYMVMLNLSFNHFEGEVPMKGVFTNSSQVALQGNGKLCSQNIEIAHELGIFVCIENKKRRSLLLPITLAVVGATALLVSIPYLIWVVMSRRKKKRKQRITSLSPAHPKGVPQTVSYGDIRIATSNFAAENLIGKGGFGYVYKGVFNLNAGEATLAVKVLDLKHSEATKSFNAECEALRIARHRNLVKVITSCSSIDYKGDEFKALVMQFMTNGNLDTWLYPMDEEETGSSLNLLQRLNIAIDVASAMDYLHHDCDPPVVHCDLKPSNVLLDEDMVAHVGDFGLARLLSQNPSQSSTLGLKGSIGYIAPEYGVGGKASTRGDVYTFGILLLEMFIAKRPTDEMFHDGLSLNKLASSMTESNQVMKVVDPRLFKDYDHSRNSSWASKAEECLGGVIRIGLSCAAREANDRLSMREASTKLQGIRHSLLSL